MSCTRRRRIEDPWQQYMVNINTENNNDRYK